MYRWTRGLDGAPGAGKWAAGVALERRGGAGGRWQTLSRREAEGVGDTLPEGRLSGWEAGLVASWGEAGGAVGVGGH